MALLSFNTPAPNDLDNKSFDYIRDRIYELAGIALSPAKKDLVQTRIRKRLAALGLPSYPSYVDRLKSLGKNDEEWQFLVNALTTNKTEFFREPAHFEFLEKLSVSEWLKRRTNPLAVWSAASSTGEEPYSIAMTLDRVLRGSGKDFTITASDIDTEVIAYARKGVYQNSTITHLPDHLWKPYVDMGTGGIAEWCRIKPTLKRVMSFHQVNLVHDPCPWPAAFDVIFCRNVLIYFSQESIKKTIDHLYEAAKPGAYLFISHTESLQNIRTPWEGVRPSIFRKPE